MPFLCFIEKLPKQPPCPALRPVAGDNFETLVWVVIDTRAETARFGTTQALNDTVRFWGDFSRLEGLRALFFFWRCWGITPALACGMSVFGVILGHSFSCLHFIYNHMFVYMIQ